jgi:superfamily II DNA or RNA helicase
LGKVSSWVVKVFTNNKTDIIITKKNDVYVEVKCDSDIGAELSEHFTLPVPGARFMPAYKNKVWDGKIRLFNVNGNLILFGLRFAVVRFARKRKYTFSIFDNSKDIDRGTMEEFVKALELPMEPREYQLDGIYHAIKHSRALLLSPTASGKSLIIYCLVRYYMEMMEKKILILVPTTNLVVQLHKDFRDYGFDAVTHCHCITAGFEKTAKKRIYISTWQSLYRQKRNYFDQFGTIFVDEAHLAKAKSLSGIMEKLSFCEFRFGLTGTLSKSKIDQMTLTGLFDEPKRIISTKELIDSKYISNLKINCLVLNHSDADKRIAKLATDYRGECDYLVANKARNDFVVKLAASLKGNTLVLFQYVEKHGIPLCADIKGQTTKDVRYISGIIKTDEREATRTLTEENDNVIIVASNAIFSTGINIKNLHNIVFAWPSKSQVRVLQSIGRGLRLHESKEVCNVYDIADNLSLGKKKNFGMLHFNERCSIYSNELFNVKITKINLP